MNGTLFYAMLGNLNLFELAGIAGGAITPDATNTGRYKMFNLTIGRNVLQQIMGDYTELQFSAIGGPDTVWIDDVVYVPPPAAVVVMTGLALFRRRRPGA